MNSVEQVALKIMLLELKGEISRIGLKPYMGKVVVYRRISEFKKSEPVFTVAYDSFGYFFLIG